MTAATSPALALPELPTPAWFVIDTPGADFDQTFVPSREEARDYNPEVFPSPLFDDAQMLTYGQQCAQAQGEAQAAEIAELKAQRDAWREVAEDQYAKLRTALYGDEGYPVVGALDAYAAVRHPALASCNRYAALKSQAA